MRIKPNSAYKTREFFLNPENLAYASVSLYGHLQGGVVRRICGKELKLMYKNTIFYTSV